MVVGTADIEILGIATDVFPAECMVQTSQKGHCVFFVTGEQVLDIGKTDFLLLPEKNWSLSLLAEPPSLIHQLCFPYLASETLMV